MAGQIHTLDGRLVTPEDALRAAASFVQQDLDSLAGIVRGRVAWEYVLQLDVGNGRAFELRVKIWQSGVAALPYRFARSVHAQAPRMMSPYVGNDVASSVREAMVTAVRDTLYQIEQAQAAGETFNPSWLKPNPDYPSTLNFED